MCGWEHRVAFSSCIPRLDYANVLYVHRALPHDPPLCSSVRCVSGTLPQTKFSSFRRSSRYSNNPKDVLLRRHTHVRPSLVARLSLSLSCRVVDVAPSFWSVRSTCTPSLGRLSQPVSFACASAWAWCVHRDRWCRDLPSSQEGRPGSTEHHTPQLTIIIHCTGPVVLS